MALLDVFYVNPLVAFPTFFLGLILHFCVFRLLTHPLKHIPGPLLAKVTPLWLYYHAYIGDEASVIHDLHVKYGKLVCVAPNEVDISDADAVTPIYVSKGGFPKAPCYRNFDIDGHATLFSELDAEQRSPRAKAVISMFSTKNIKESEEALYGCMDRLVERMQDEAKTGRPVNLLNLTRGLALDAVSTHLFQENYNGTSEKGNRLSASAFVDTFVAVGRFFYLPNAVFLAVEWAIEKFFPDQHVKESFATVASFIETLVSSTPKGAQNYPGRLQNLGLDPSEVKAQVKDLMFAGTDSTGMNLATICRYLALNPEKYETLRAEILSNAKAGPAKKETQSLPYLTGVVKESLRLSMANPTRLPRLVPEPGWEFKGTHFPAGSIVGVSAYELHLNPEVFPVPRSFQPARWLEGNMTPEISKHYFAFGAGPRVCIARNLAMTELYMATEKLVESDVLRGARACQKEVEIYEWFNSSVKGEKMELIWEK